MNDPIETHLHHPQRGRSLGQLLCPAQSIDTATHTRELLFGAQDVSKSLVSTRGPTEAQGYGSEGEGCLRGFVEFADKFKGPVLPQEVDRARNTAKRGIRARHVILRVSGEQVPGVIAMPLMRQCRKREQV